MTIIEKARIQRENIVKAMRGLDDKDVSMTPELLGRLSEDNSLIPAGTRINWNGTIKRAATDLWDTVENNPENAPSLWEDINYKEGYRIIPETITVTTAFAKDEMGWCDGVLYRSLMNTNVYTPKQYPDGWEKV